MGKATHKKSLALSGALPIVANVVGHDGGVNTPPFLVRKEECQRTRQCLLFWEVRPASGGCRRPPMGGTKPEKRTTVTASNKPRVRCTCTVYPIIILVLPDRGTLLPPTPTQPPMATTVAQMDGTLLAEVTASKTGSTPDRIWPCGIFYLAGKCKNLHQYVLKKVLFC